MDYIPSGKPHGNTQKEKQMKSYRKTYKSTLQSLREISDIKKPKSVYETVRKSIGSYRCSFTKKLQASSLYKACSFHSVEIGGW